MRELPNPWIEEPIEALSWLLKPIPFVPATPDENAAVMAKASPTSPAVAVAEFPDMPEFLRRKIA